MTSTSQNNKTTQASLACLDGKLFTVPDRQPGTLAEYICELVAVNLESEYIEIDRYGRKHSSTYGDLFKQARSYVPLLQKRQSEGTDIVILCFENILDFVVAAWACLFSGVRWVPMSSSGMNSNNGYFETQIGLLLETYANRMVFSDHHLGTIIAERFSIIDAQDLVFMESLDVAMEPPPEARNFRDASGDILIATSGTTGKPKLAILDADTLMNRFFDGYTLNHRVSLYSMAHHSVAGIRMLLPLGERIVYLHPLRLAASPRQWFSIVGEYGVTDAGMSSTIAAMLLQLAKRQALPFSMGSLERLGFGAEIIIPDLINSLLDMLRKLGSRAVSLSFVYSMTETGPICRSITEDTEFAKMFVEPGEMLAMDNGVPGWSVRITNAQNHGLQQGEIGQIQVYSNCKLFAGYLNHARADYMTDDGWFKTGDLGQILNNKLIPLGRENTVININARKIACEELEKVLEGIEGIDGHNFFTAPVRTQTSHTDEVAVFFVPKDFTIESVNSIRRSILSAISTSIGVAVKHLVAVQERDIERTDNFKIKRALMIERYLQGAWDNLLNQHSNPALYLKANTVTPVQRIWMEALGLSDPPLKDQTFADLGGDSLGAAMLVAAYEEEFARPLPLNEFFSEPTVSNMVKLANQGPHTIEQNATDSMKNAATMDSLVHSVGAYTGAWKGNRMFADSMIVGHNIRGKKTPLFWVFQGNLELLALADELGAKQPLYGMRSCVSILPIKDYDENILQSLLDRYLWEILAIVGQRDFYLGGNCQGGIIALLLAKRLSSVKLCPRLVFLHEWAFDYGQYGSAVEIIYGEKSYTAERFSPDAMEKYDHAMSFPNLRVSSVPGGHGKFFEDDQVPFLGQVLRNSMNG